MSKKKEKPTLSPYQPFEATEEHKQKKWREAVKLLNEIVKIKVAPSKVDGVGVVAMRDLKKGEKIYADAIFHVFDLPYSMFPKLRKDVREIIVGRWPQVVNGSNFFYPDTKMTAYLNHSDKPNYDAIKDKMLKDVKKGEEIFEDYKQIKNWQEIFPWLSTK
jgi:SET domain-containing protein